VPPPAPFPLTGASNAGRVGRNRGSEPISGFTACCQRICFVYNYSRAEFRCSNQIRSKSVLELSQYGNYEKLTCRRETARRHVLYWECSYLYSFPQYRPRIVYVYFVLNFLLDGLLHFNDRKQTFKITQSRESIARLASHSLGISLSLNQRNTGWTTLENKRFPAGYEMWHPAGTEFCRIVKIWFDWISVHP